MIPEVVLPLSKGKAGPVFLLGLLPVLGLLQ